MHATLRRAGGYAAITAPIVMWCGFFAAALNRHGYNLLTRPFSDLATRGTSNSTLFDVGFFLVPGVLVGVAGVGLWFARRGSPSNRAWRTGAALVVGTGFFLFLTGVFQQDPRSVVAGILHGTVSQICFAVASAAPVILFFASSKDVQLDPPRRLWLMTGLAAVGIELGGLALKPVLHYADGFFQRPFTVALTIWFLATGAWLLRARSAEGLSLAD